MTIRRGEAIISVTSKELLKYEDALYMHPL